MPNSVIPFICTSCKKIPKKQFHDEEGNVYCKNHSPSKATPLLTINKLHIYCPNQLSLSTEDEGNDGSVQVTKQCAWTGMIKNLETHLETCYLSKGDQSSLNDQIKQLKQKVQTMDETIGMMKKQISKLEAQNEEFQQYFKRRGSIDATDDTKKEIEEVSKWGLMDTQLTKMGDIITHNAEQYCRLNAFSEHAYDKNTVIFKVKILKRGHENYNSYRIGLVPTDTVVINRYKGIDKFANCIAFFGNQKAIKLGQSDSMDTKLRFGDPGDTVRIVADFDASFASFWVNGKKLEKNVPLIKNVRYRFAVTCGQVGDQIQLL